MKPEPSLTNALQLTPTAREQLFVPVFFIGLLVVFFGLFYETTWTMVSTWYEAETYTHGFLILPIVAWLIWRRRTVLQNLRPTPQFLALIPLAAAGFLWMLGSLVDVQVVQQFALITMVVAAFLTVMGTDIAKALIFPLAFLFFAVPMGEELVPPLMEYTATVTVALVKLSGIPVYREGMFIALPSGNWSVVEACSGIRYLIASVTLGCLFAYINYSSMKKRLAFILVASIVPIIANGLRAYMIVMIGHLSGMELAVGVDHLIYGWVFFGLVMLILFVIGAKWSDPEQLPAHSGSTSETKSSERSFLPGSAVVLAVFATLAIAAIWPAWVFALNQGGETKPAAVEFVPERLGEFTLSTDVFWDWYPQHRGNDSHIKQFYVYQNQNDAEGQPAVMLDISQYLRQERGAELISGQNRLFNRDVRDWRVFPMGGESVDLNGETTWVLSAVVKGPGQNLLVWRWYRIGDQYTANDYVAKFYELSARLLENRRDGAIITLAVPIDFPGESEQMAVAEEKLQRFIHPMLPELEKSLDQEFSGAKQP